MRKKLEFSKVLEQKGRSLVELLGVLAVAGAMSVMGLYGFGYAMEKWRENETLDRYAKVVAGARTSRILEDENEGYRTKYTVDGINHTLRDAFERQHVDIKKVISNVGDDDDYADDDRPLGYLLAPQKGPVNQFNNVDGFVKPADYEPKEVEIWVDVRTPSAFTVHARNLTLNTCKRIVQSNLGHNWGYESANDDFTGTDADDFDGWYTAPQLHNDAEAEKLCKTIVLSNGAQELVLWFGDTECISGTTCPKPPRPMCLSGNESPECDGANPCGDDEYCSNGCCYPINEPDPETTDPEATEPETTIKQCPVGTTYCSTLADGELNCCSGNQECKDGECVGCPSWAPYRCSEEACCESEQMCDTDTGMCKYPACPPERPNECYNSNGDLKCCTSSQVCVNGTCEVRTPNSSSSGGSSGGGSSGGGSCSDVGCTGCYMDTGSGRIQACCGPFTGLDGGNTRSCRNNDGEQELGDISDFCKRCMYPCRDDDSKSCCEFVGRQWAADEPGSQTEETKGTCCGVSRQAVTSSDGKQQRCCPLGSPGYVTRQGKFMCCENGNVGTNEEGVDTCCPNSGIPYLSENGEYKCCNAGESAVDAVFNSSGKLVSGGGCCPAGKKAVGDAYGNGVECCDENDTAVPSYRNPTNHHVYSGKCCSNGATAVWSGSYPNVEAKCCPAGRTAIPGGFDADGNYTEGICCEKGTQAYIKEIDSHGRPTYACCDGNATPAEKDEQGKEIPGYCCKKNSEGKAGTPYKKTETEYACCDGGKAVDAGTIVELVTGQSQSVEEGFCCPSKNGDNETIDATSEIFLGEDGWSCCGRGEVAGTVKIGNKVHGGCCESGQKPYVKIVDNQPKYGCCKGKLKLAVFNEAGTMLAPPACCTKETDTPIIISETESKCCSGEGISASFKEDGTLKHKGLCCESGTPFIMGKENGDTKLDCCASGNAISALFGEGRYAPYGSGEPIHAGKCCQAGQTPWIDANRGANCCPKGQSAISSTFYSDGTLKTAGKCCEKGKIAYLKNDNTVGCCKGAAISANLSEQVVTGGGSGNNGAKCCEEKDGYKSVWVDIHSAPQCCKGSSVSATKINGTMVEGGCCENGTAMHDEEGKFMCCSGTVAYEEGRTVCNTETTSPVIYTSDPEGTETTSPGGTETTTPDGTVTTTPDNGEDGVYGTETTSPYGSETTSPEGSETTSPKGSMTDTTTGSVYGTETTSPEGSETTSPEGSMTDTTTGGVYGTETTTPDVSTETSYGTETTVPPVSTSETSMTETLTPKITETSTPSMTETSTPRMTETSTPSMTETTTSDPMTTTTITRMTETTAPEMTETSTPRLMETSTSAPTTTMTWTTETQTPTPLTRTTTMTTTTRGTTTTTERSYDTETTEPSLTETITSAPMTTSAPTTTMTRTTETQTPTPLTRTTTMTETTTSVPTTTTAAKTTTTTTTTVADTTTETETTTTRRGGGGVIYWYTDTTSLVETTSEDVEDTMSHAPETTVRSSSWW